MPLKIRKGKPKTEVEALREMVDQLQQDLSVYRRMAERNKKGTSYLLAMVAGYLVYVDQRDKNPIGIDTMSRLLARTSLEEHVDPFLPDMQEYQERIMRMSRDLRADGTVMRWWASTPQGVEGGNRTAQEYSITNVSFQARVSERVEQETQQRMARLIAEQIDTGIVDMLTGEQNENQAQAGTGQRRDRGTEEESQGPGERPAGANP